MIVMIEEIPGAAMLARLDDNHITVRRAWVQHHRDLVVLLGERIRDPHQWLFMGLPLGIASEKEWNRLLLLEGSKKVTALDWPPIVQTEAARTNYVLNTPYVKHMTKYVA
jgi:hypothetical protein